MPNLASEPDACPSCGAESPAGTRFCPHCGARLDGDESSEAPVSAATTPLDVTFGRTARHTFGLAPPEALLALAAVTLVIAVALFALGHWIFAGLSLMTAVVFARFFVWTSRRLPGKRVAQLAVAASDAASGHAGFARVSISSWWSANWALLRQRTLQRRIAYEQRGLINALGEAVFRGDNERAEQLKAKARACGERIAEHERELALAIAAARERVSRERVAIQQTERLSHGHAAASPTADE
jgi:hypothetical protein